MTGRPKTGEANPTVEATCYSRKTRFNRIFALSQAFYYNESLNNKRNPLQVLTLLAVTGRPKIGEAKRTVEATPESSQTGLNRIFATLILMKLFATMNA